MVDEVRTAGYRKPVTTSKGLISHRLGDEARPAVLILTGT